MSFENPNFKRESEGSVWQDAAREDREARRELNQEEWRELVGLDQMRPARLFFEGKMKRAVELLAKAKNTLGEEELNRRLAIERQRKLEETQEMSVEEIRSRAKTLREQAMHGSVWGDALKEDAEAEGVRGKHIKKRK